MCKVLIMPKVNGPKAIEFAKLMGKEMSPGNMDGLGYAAVDKDGKLFGERWLKNSDAFTVLQDEMLLLKDVLVSPPSPGESTNFGDQPDISKAVALTLHTRYATSEKGMKNTHPFVHEDMDSSLIHNGVIDNHRDFKLKVSTCDSEAILVSYLDKEVNLKPDVVEQMARSLSGYYACGVFSRDAEGNRILDVFKGNSASLSVMYIKELETYIFTTSAADALSACKTLGFNRPDTYMLSEGQLLRFNPLTGKLLNTTKFFVPARGGSSSSWNRSSGGTIVDASISGNKSKPAPMTDGMLVLMKLKPSLRELSKAETLELIRAEYSTESFSA